MADGQHKLSRRALLGASLAPLILSGAERSRSAWSKDAPVLSRHSGLDPESMNTALVQPDTAVTMDSGFRRNDEWDRTLARFQAAQAEVDAARGESDQERYDGLCDSATESLSALLALPAPDLAALAAKLEIIVPHLAWELTGAEDCLERVRQDARRLAATAV
jgi:hypothetical protein